MLYQKGHMILNPCIAVKCLASNLANPRLGCKTRHVNTTIMAMATN